jgi:hypothetical protein
MESEASATLSDGENKESWFAECGWEVLRIFAMGNWVGCDVLREAKRVPMSFDNKVWLSNHKPRITSSQLVNMHRAVGRFRQFTRQQVLTAGGVRPSLHSYREER